MEEIGFFATPYIAVDSGILAALDFHVLLMIGGTMGLVQLFIDSHRPGHMTDRIMDKIPNVR